MPSDFTVLYILRPAAVGSDYYEKEVSIFNTLSFYIYFVMKTRDNVVCSV